MANNPIKYVDYRGDSISVSDIQKYDKENETNYLQTIMEDLNSQTGLTYSVNDRGMLVYNKDADGKLLGSETARNLMRDAISHEDIAKVLISKSGGSNSVVGGLSINLDISQIQGFINGVNNLDSKTLGWGMTFMHETIHSKVGGGLSDRPFSEGIGSFSPGPTVTKMNIIRAELNAQGHNYGQRGAYRALNIGGSHYIPFDNASRIAITYGGEAPIPRSHKFINIR